MSAAERFFDTNILLYLLSGDDVKANRAEEELGAGGVISVQVLNEFAAVASRKLKMSVAEIREALEAIRAVCRVVPLSEETHDRGMQIIERYGLSVYDAMIAASALLAGCDAIMSEDMRDGLILDGRVEIRNPFH
jgi:predicted nucleic acid-binding protein